MILKFNVKEQTISLVNTKSVPRIGSKDYLVLQFSFSSDWANLNKLVYLQNGDISQSVSIVDDSVEVPEWFTEQSSFNVTLFGTDGTTEVPTNVVSVQLEKSNDLWEKDAPEPQQSWFVAALESAEKAKASEDAAKVSEHNAAGSASSAQESAESASTNALNASASASAAANSAADAQAAQSGSEAARDRAEAAAIKQSYPNAETETWWVWDANAGAYKDSGVSFVGKSYEAELEKKITAPAFASIGQTIRVKSVDENGKPTEWEASEYVTDEHINSLIDEKLGVIENGTY